MSPLQAGGSATEIHCPSEGGGYCGGGGLTVRVEDADVTVSTSTVSGRPLWTGAADKQLGCV